MDPDVSWARARPSQVVAPCMLRSRTQGQWLLSRGRRVRVAEAARLQGLVPDSVRWPSSTALCHAMLGNAMAVNVVERVLVCLLRALRLRGGSSDAWASGLRQAELVQSRGRPLEALPHPDLVKRRR